MQLLTLARCKMFWRVIRVIVAPFVLVTIFVTALILFEHDASRPPDSEGHTYSTWFTLIAFVLVILYDLYLYRILTYGEKNRK